MIKKKIHLFQVVFFLCGSSSCGNLISAPMNITLKPMTIASPIKGIPLVKVSYSQKSISMGDPVIMKVIIQSKKMLLLKPVYLESDKIEILAPLELYSEFSNHKWIYSYIYEFTFFDLGEFDLGDLKIYYSQANQNSVIKKNQPLVVKLEKIKVNGFKMTKKSKMKPFTQGLKVYFAWDYLIYSIIAFILFVYLIVRLIYKIKNRKKSERELTDKRDAIEFFTQETNLLSEMVVNDSIEILDAITQCDFNLKEYIERKFNIQIRENTNRENKKILKEILQNNFDSGWQWLQHVENIKYNPNAVIDDKKACEKIIHDSLKIINNIDQTQSQKLLKEEEL